MIDCVSLTLSTTRETVGSGATMNAFDDIFSEVLASCGRVALFVNSFGSMIVFRIARTPQIGNFFAFTGKTMLPFFRIITACFL